MSRSSVCEMMTTMASSWSATAPALEEEEEEEEQHIKVSHINTETKEKREESDRIDVKIEQHTNVEMHREESEKMKIIQSNLRTREHLKPNTSQIITNVEINKEKATNVKDDDIIRIGHREREESVWGGRSERNEREGWDSSRGTLATSGGTLESSRGTLETSRGTLETSGGTLTTRDDVFRDNGILQDFSLEGRTRTTAMHVQDKKRESRSDRERGGQSSWKAKEGGEEERWTRSHTGQGGERRSWKAEGGEEGRWTTTHTAGLPGNGFSTEQDETGYRETKEIGEKGRTMTKNRVWPESKIAQSRISRGANIEANMSSFEANGTDNSDPPALPDLNPRPGPSQPYRSKNREFLVISAVVLPTTTFPLCHPALQESRNVGLKMAEIIVRFLTIEMFSST